MEKTADMTDLGPIEEHAQESESLQNILSQVSQVLANAHTGLQALSVGLTEVRREYATHAATSIEQHEDLDYLAVKRIANEVEVITTALGGTMRRLARMAKTD